MSTQRRALSLSCCLLASLAGPLARAQAPGEACSSAYARGQQERLAGRLYTARAAFIACSASGCPAATASDCARWRSEVEADLPTVRVHVANERGQAVVGLQVFADGVSIPAADWAAPLILEAGPHDFRFEAPGYAPLQLEKALRPSDREVEVAVTLRPPAPATLPPDRAPRSRGVPPASVAFAGVGVFSLGAALYFGLEAHGQYRDLQQSCAPRCSQSQADSLYTKAVLSDVALATAVAAFGVSAWFYFSRSSASPVATSLDVRARPGGAQLGLTTAF
jgi:hypothetical protein